MTNHIVTCRVCGAKYPYCYACDRKRSWRGLADTVDHYYILLALMTYRTDHDAEKAYRILHERGLDFLHTEEFIPDVRDRLAEIYSVVHGSEGEQEITDMEVEEQHE